MNFEAPTPSAPPMYEDASSDENIEAPTPSAPPMYEEQSSDENNEPIGQETGPKKGEN